MPKKRERQTQSKAQERIDRTEAYANKVRSEFADAVNTILALNKKIPELKQGVMYSFDGAGKSMRREVDDVLRQLHSVTVASIRSGITQEWNIANKEVDELIASALGKKALSNPKLSGWFERNEQAMTAFTKRTENGFNLSNSIWKDTRQLREEMEVAMTVAIGEGQSASQISRKVRQYLNDPDLMFRRFRYKDDDGEWQTKWKKKVMDDNGKYHFIDYDKDSYKTGAGVYKSSYRNAMRVARTETNMAYRRADNDRWSRLDFVLGQHIELSRSHPKEDICDDLQGDYPKDFLFEGWHPQCFCICTPILASEEEMEKRMDAVVNGEEYESDFEPITTYPEGFQNFVEENKKYIEDSMKRGTAPYFIANNEDVVNRILDGENLTGEKEKGIKTLEEVKKEFTVFKNGKTDEQLQEEWNSNIAKNFDFLAVKQGIKDTMEEHGLKMGRCSISLKENSFTVKLADDSGLLQIQRLLSRQEDGTVTAEHQKFVMGDEFQGKGISKKVYSIFYEQYLNMGVGRIDIHANLDVGGYTWARYGFYATSEAQVRSVVRYNRASEELKGKATEIVNDFYSDESNKGKPFPMNKIVEELGKDDAKHILLHTSWDGVLNMKDKKQRKLFESYLGL